MSGGAATGVVATVAEPEVDELRKALERLDYERKEDLDYGCTARDDATDLLDTTDDDETIVAERGPELTELTGLVDRDELLRWVTTVRETLLKQRAYDFNRIEASRESDVVWKVEGGRRLVSVAPPSPSGKTVRLKLVDGRLVARPVRPIARLLTRVRIRRARRTAVRRTAVRRSPSRSPGRQEDPDPPARPLASEAAA